MQYQNDFKKIMYMHGRNLGMCVFVQDQEEFWI